MTAFSALLPARATISTPTAGVGGFSLLPVLVYVADEYPARVAGAGYKLALGCLPAPRSRVRSRRQTGLGLAGPPCPRSTWPPRWTGPRGVLHRPTQGRLTRLEWPKSSSGTPEQCWRPLKKR